MTKPNLFFISLASLVFSSCGGNSVPKELKLLAQNSPNELKETINEYDLETKITANSEYHYSGSYRCVATKGSTRYIMNLAFTATANKGHREYFEFQIGNKVAYNNWEWKVCYLSIKDTYHLSFSINDVSVHDGEVNRIYTSGDIYDNAVADLDFLDDIMFKSFDNICTSVNGLPFTNTFLLHRDYVNNR